MQSQSWPNSKRTYNLRGHAIQANIYATACSEVVSQRCPRHMFSGLQKFQVVPLILFVSGVDIRKTSASNTLTYIP